VRELLFFAGTPGSRWSSVSQQIAKVSGTNRSDETAARDFQHSKFSGHKGMYFGPGMELGQRFHELSQISDSEIWNEVDRAYGEAQPGGTRIVKCHQFATQLDHIAERFPQNRLMMVYRPDDVCYDWWMTIGGFEIKYPRYDWYENPAQMKKHIANENRHILAFCEKRRLKPELFTPQWVEKNFGERVELDSKFGESYFSDVYAAITP